MSTTIPSLVKGSSKCWRTSPEGGSFRGRKTLPTTGNLKTKDPSRVTHTGVTYTRARVFRKILLALSLFLIFAGQVDAARESDGSCGTDEKSQPSSSQRSSTTSEISPEDVWELPPKIQYRIEKFVGNGLINRKKIYDIKKSWRSPLTLSGKTRIKVGALVIGNFKKAQAEAATRGLLINLFTWLNERIREGNKKRGFFNVPKSVLTRKYEGFREQLVKSVRDSFKKIHPGNGIRQPGITSSHIHNNGYC